MISDCTPAYSDTSRLTSTPIPEMENVPPETGNPERTEETDQQTLLQIVPENTSLTSQEHQGKSDDYSETQSSEKIKKNKGNISTALKFSVTFFF